MNLTVVVPAFNEADYLPATLDALEAAIRHVRQRSGAEVETVVVDNNSSDDTAAVARSRAAVVVHEPCRASRGPATQERATGMGTCWSSSTRTCSCPLPSSKPSTTR